MLGLPSSDDPAAKRNDAILQIPDREDQAAPKTIVDPPFPFDAQTHAYEIGCSNALSHRLAVEKVVAGRRKTQVEKPNDFIIAVPRRKVIARDFSRIFCQHDRIDSRRPLVSAA